MALYIVKPWYKKEEPPTPALIYGAEWAGGSSPVWTRTDAAANFADPNPYYSGMSGTPSSPFDDILPWSGLRRVTDSAAGELVEIPKFYYKWTRDGAKMKLQISADQFDGALVSPAHADRGDGVGERDYVYIGRYHCASDYMSKTGVLPLLGTNTSFPAAIHNLGTDCYIFDYAAIWTIRILYLVEFANWNSEAMIGYGCSPSNAYFNMGYTDSMPYHTGTDRTSKTNYGGTQYRYIEGLWDNVFEIIGGLYCDSTSIYLIKNPANYSQQSGGVKIADKLPNQTWGYETSWTNPNTMGLEYALYPNAVGGSNSTYICDTYYTDSTGVCVAVGGNYDRDPSRGLFCTNDSNTNSTTNGTRLMVLPPNRLSA